MRRLIVVAFAALLVATVLGRIARGRLPQLIEAMMENAMPQMMDRCFGAMSAERREFMLSHCRGMLDLMERKYVTHEVA